MKTKVTDLSLFDNVEGNRKIKKLYASRLAKSIKEDNMLEQNPLIAVEDNGRYRLIDGQHRLVAAKLNNVPVWVEIVNMKELDKELDKVHRLNTFRRNWDNNDYIDSYIQKRVEDYSILKSFVGKYHLSITMSATMLMDESMRLDEVTDILRAGDFKVNRLAEAVKEAQDLSALSPFVEGNIWFTIPFVRAVKIVWEKIGVERLLSSCEKYPTKMRARISTREYLRDLEDRVNYRTQANTVRFY